MFGESSYDQRDFGFGFGFGFAALKSSMYLANVLAARGQLSPLDANAWAEQVRHGLEIVPEQHLPPAARDVIEQSFADVKMMAEQFFRPGEQT